MRKVTKNIVGVISLGVLAASWSIGQAAESGLVIGSPAATGTPAPSASDTSTAAETPAPTASETVTSSPAPTKTTNSAAKSVSKKSDAVSYVAHRNQGTMQISVTKLSGKITDVSVLSGGTEGGEWASVPGLLAQAAIDAQGSNFGNIGGATHTTDAFKTALENALAKF